MHESENVHSGHRERMIEKIINNPDSLADHELLEVLLFFSIPRRDTNQTAHNLLRTFGSLSNLFEADAKSISAVNGVGIKTASLIKTCGELVFKTEKERGEPKKCFSAFAKIKQELIDYFANERSEKSLVLLLDKNYIKISELSFTDNDTSSVNTDLPELVHAFAILKPASIILAHNHPSGNPSPSKDDDFTTAKINMLCSVHGVMLADHVIVSGDEVYSYRRDNRLEDINRNYAIDNVLKTIKE